MVSTLSDEQYEEIFRAVLVRYPADDGPLEQEDKEGFDSLLDEEEGNEGMIKNNVKISRSKFYY